MKREEALFKLVEPVEIETPFKCPKCGGILKPVTESYKDDDVYKISVSFVCMKCGTRFILPLPLVEYR